MRSTTSSRNSNDAAISEKSSLFNLPNPDWLTDGCSDPAKAEQRKAAARKAADTRKRNKQTKLDQASVSRVDTPIASEDLSIEPPSPPPQPLPLLLTSEDSQFEGPHAMTHPSQIQRQVHVPAEDGDLRRAAMRRHSRSFSSEVQRTSPAAIITPLPPLSTENDDQHRSVTQTLGRERRNSTDPDPVTKFSPNKAQGPEPATRSDKSEPSHRSSSSSRTRSSEARRRDEDMKKMNDAIKELQERNQVPVKGSDRSNSRTGDQPECVEALRERSGASF